MATESKATKSNVGGGSGGGADAAGKSLLAGSMGQQSAEEAELIDRSTFDQLLEMDDDDDREFSKSIVWNYFEQAETTFSQMEDMLQKKDLAQLSSLGHFLKGSSAALGLTRVKQSCECIQHFGAKKDESGTEDVPDDELCLKRIEDTLDQVKGEYAQAEQYLKRIYGEG